MVQDSVETVASRINPRFRHQYGIQNLHSYKILKMINETLYCLNLFFPHTNFQAAFDADATYV
jgi:hypothetical protein